MGDDNSLPMGKGFMAFLFATGWIHIKQFSCLKFPFVNSIVSNAEFGLKFPFVIALCRKQSLAYLN